MNLLIKKSQIAVSSSDARPSRFVGGERIDAAISELNMEKRKVSLSIKLLEELQNKEKIEEKKRLEFSEKIDELNQETNTLMDEIDKWQT